MKKICRIAIVFLLIFNLYLSVFNVEAAYVGDINKPSASVGDTGSESSTGSSSSTEGSGSTSGTSTGTSQGIWDIGKNFLDIGANASGTGFDTTIVNDAFAEIIDFLWGNRITCDFYMYDSTWNKIYVS